MDDWSERILSSTWRWRDTIESFRLTDIKYISSGTFAVVYRATLLSKDGGRGDTVALKVLKPYKAKQTLARRSFLQEMAVHSLLKHEHIVEFKGTTSLPLTTLLPVTTDRDLLLGQQALVNQQPHPFPAPLPAVQSPNDSTVVLQCCGACCCLAAPSSSTAARAAGKNVLAEGTVHGHMTDNMMTETAPITPQPSSTCYCNHYKCGTAPRACQGMCSHNNGYGVMNQSPYHHQCWVIVMEFMSEGNLYDRLTAPQPAYKGEEALTWLTQLASALNYMHSRMPLLIHRDVKPENVLLGRCDADRVHRVVNHTGYQEEELTGLHSNQRAKQPNSNSTTVAKLCDFGLISVIGAGGLKLQPPDVLVLPDHLQPPPQHPAGVVPPVDKQRRLLPGGASSIVGSGKKLQRSCSSEPGHLHLSRLQASGRPAVLPAVSTFNLGSRHVVHLEGTTGVHPEGTTGAEEQVMAVGRSCADVSSFEVSGRDGRYDVIERISSHQDCSIESISSHQDCSIERISSHQDCSIYVDVREGTTQSAAFTGHKSAQVLSSGISSVKNFSTACSSSATSTISSSLQPPSHATSVPSHSISSSFSRHAAASSQKLPSVAVSCPNEKLHLQLLKQQQAVLHDVNVVELSSFSAPAVAAAPCTSSDTAATLQPSLSPVVADTSSTSHLAAVSSTLLPHGGKPTLDVVVSEAELGRDELHDALTEPRMVLDATDGSVDDNMVSALATTYGGIFMPAETEGRDDVNKDGPAAAPAEVMSPAIASPASPATRSLVEAPASPASPPTRSLVEAPDSSPASTATRSLVEAPASPASPPTRSLVEAPASPASPATIRSLVKTPASPANSSPMENSVLMGRIYQGNEEEVFSVRSPFESCCCTNPPPGTSGELGVLIPSCEEETTTMGSRALPLRRATSKLSTGDKVGIQASNAAMSSKLRRGVPASDDVPDIYSQAFRLTGRVGSVMYMSPEVARGLLYNEKVDVFSFAMMAYELLTRKLLTSEMSQVDHAHAAEYLYKVAWLDWRPELVATIPSPLKLLLAMCWHKVLLTASCTAAMYWHKDPRARLSFETIFQRLKTMSTTHGSSNNNNNGSVLVELRQQDMSAAAARLLVLEHEYSRVAEEMEKKRRLQAEAASRQQKIQALKMLEEMQLALQRRLAAREQEEGFQRQVQAQNQEWLSAMSRESVNSVALRAEDQWRQASHHAAGIPGPASKVGHHVMSAAAAAAGSSAGAVAAGSTGAMISGSKSGAYLRPLGFVSGATMSAGCSPLGANAIRVSGRYPLAVLHPSPSSRMMNGAAMSSTATAAAAATSYHGKSCGTIGSNALHHSPSKQPQTPSSTSSSSRTPTKSKVSATATSHSSHSSHSSYLSNGASVTSNASASLIHHGDHQTLLLFYPAKLSVDGSVDTMLDWSPSYHRKTVSDANTHEGAVRSSDTISGAAMRTWSNTGKQQLLADANLLSPHLLLDRAHQAAGSSVQNLHLNSHRHVLARAHTTSLSGNNSSRSDNKEAASRDT
ncbi:hypothetical protein CEUSTIGMA_g1807.t1 [Chlamydomonas eustigma]|uniref:Protein kinase domain-containing protein n=1 Tax=Chlamydomonas eustigma TaxID=1157962 RepID=A0A250WU57_9CHLO|nr:hypothetical protein CEUSTIGMA_g1807.t1 [Chlamydomonas eustigma]|eukprot:GAX74358.1 hypothetical protein CEUSTIGMA_g1807.t1 [Chlamydomonas eustigma]